jgi:hypothetical protein
MILPDRFSRNHNADWEDILDDEDSEVVDDREPNRDVDKNEKTEQGKTAASD